MDAYYEYRHVVGFEETNLVGNVYYANYIRWQGRCRELFLYEHAPDVLDALQRDLALVTTHVSCEYLAELYAFDELAIRMRLQGLTQNRITMDYEYWRVARGSSKDVTEQSESVLIARGQQQIACMQRTGRELVPARFPLSLQAALQRYT
jgi:enediyne biosynthesis thioesterase